MATQPWQNKLNSYAGNATAGNAEIDRARQVYETKKAAGDMAGANAAHNWANQIRDAMGTSSNYDRTTGASIQQAQPAMLEQAQTQAAAIYDPMREAQLAQIRAAKDKALGQLDLTRQGVAPQYASLKNQTDAANVQAVQKLRELMAAQGMANSGDNVSGQVALNAQRGADINSLNLQQQQRLNEIDQSKADVNNSNDEAAVIAQLNSEQAKAVSDLKARMEDVQYRQQQFDEGVRQYNQNFGQSTLNDNRNYTLAEKQALAAIANAQDSNKLGWANYGLDAKQTNANIANGLDSNALGWAKYGLDAANSTGAAAADKTLATAKNNAMKYFDSFENADKAPIPTSIRSNLKEFYSEVLNDALQNPDPLGTIRANKQALLRKYGTWTGSHIINALENTLANYTPGE